MSSEIAKVMSDHGPRPSLGTHQRAMLAGELYVAFVPELIAVRAYAQRLQAEFNVTSGDQLARRRALLRALVSPENITAEKEDEEPWVEPPFRCDYGCHIKFGKDVFINLGCTIIDTAMVDIGDRVVMGPNVQIYSGGHLTDPTLRSGAKGPEFGKPITIGNDVWIGGAVVICPGVTIGNGVTVGAGSVVTKDVPDNVVVVGNPARVIKRVEPSAPQDTHSTEA